MRPTAVFASARDSDASYYRFRSGHFDGSEGTAMRPTAVSASDQKGQRCVLLPFPLRIRRDSDASYCRFRFGSEGTAMRPTAVSTSAVLLLTKDGDSDASVSPASLPITQFGLVDNLG